MSLRSLDTAADALRVQRSALGDLDPGARVRAALEMSDAVRRIRLSGIRSRHPDATEGETLARYIAQVHGSGRTRIG